MRSFSATNLVAMAKQWLVQWSSIQELLQSVKGGSVTWQTIVVTLQHDCRDLADWCQAVLQEDQRLRGNTAEAGKMPDEIVKRYKVREGYSKLAVLNHGEYWIICLAEFSHIRRTLDAMKSWKDLTALEQVRLWRCQRKFKLFISRHRMAVTPSLILQVMKKCAENRYGDALVDDIVCGTGKPGYFIGDPRRDVDFGLVDQAYALGRGVALR